MGAVSGALEQAARAAGAELRCEAEVVAVEPDGDGVAVRWRDAGGGERVAVARHVLANVAPAVLDAPARRPRRRPTAARGRPAEGQLAAARGCRGCATRAVDPAEAFAGTFHVNEGYAQLQRAYEQAAAGALPDVAAVRDLLPLAHRPDDPRRRAARAPARRR